MTYPTTASPHLNTATAQHPASTDIVKGNIDVGTWFYPSLWQSSAVIEPGTHSFDIYLFSNAYVGFDRKMTVSVTIEDESKREKFRFHEEDMLIDREPGPYDVLAQAMGGDEDENSDFRDSDEEQEDDEEGEGGDDEDVVDASELEADSGAGTGAGASSEDGKKAAATTATTKKKQQQQQQKGDASTSDEKKGEEVAAEEEDFEEVN